MRLLGCTANFEHVSSMRSNYGKFQFLSHLMSYSIFLWSQYCSYLTFRKYVVREQFFLFYFGALYCFMKYRQKPTKETHETRRSCIYPYIYSPLFARSLPSIQHSSPVPATVSQPTKAMTRGSRPWRLDATVHWVHCVRQQSRPIFVSCQV